MNFSSMDYFVELARERNFTRAAAKLHITQQSLSSHIASLEQELGTQLLVRRVPLELTYAGEVFLRYAKHFQQECGDMRREFDDITANQRGVLRIGIAFTRGRAIMPDILRRFKTTCPNICVELAEDKNRALAAALTNREIDLAIAAFPEPLPEINLIDFYREEIVLVIPDRILANSFFAPGTDASPEAVSESLRAAIGAGDLSAFAGGPLLLGSTEDIAGRITEVGTTIDDAAGEAYDKVARVLGLGYPGGPVMDAAAQLGDPSAIRFPRGLTAPKDLVKHRFNFSFSGLKTAASRWVETARRDGVEVPTNDVAASFQEAVADVLTAKAVDMATHYGLSNFLLGGGVAANSRLRELLEERLGAHGVSLRRPRPSLCTDNGAMIAALGSELVRRGLPPSSLEIGAQPSLPVSSVLV